MESTPLPSTHQRSYPSWVSICNYKDQYISIQPSCSVLCTISYHIIDSSRFILYVCQLILRVWFWLFVVFIVGCVYVKKESIGSIQSPNFPAIYPTEMLCLYYIESVNRIPINITFSSFDLEFSSRGTCENDYVMVCIK